MIFPDNMKNNDKPSFRVLSLDGGGSKGFYSLGALQEIERFFGRPLCELFDLVYGTSTGAIIGTLIALGYSVDDILALYRSYFPEVMSAAGRAERSVRLSQLADEVFKDQTFDNVKTNLGVVATRWTDEQPMIFRGIIGSTSTRTDTLFPGFGVRISDAVQASCSAYPFFLRKIVTTSTGEKLELMDGGYSANNPTLYAICDAIETFGIERQKMDVVSIGVGVYREPEQNRVIRFLKKHLVSIQLLQKTLNVNSQSMEQLRSILFRDVKTIRINKIFDEQSMAMGLLERDLDKLDVLWDEGRRSIANYEVDLKAMMRDVSILT